MIYTILIKRAENAKFFAIADPPQAIAIHAKPEEAVVEHAGSESSEVRLPLPEGEARASSSGTLPENSMSATGGVTIANAVNVSHIEIVPQDPVPTDLGGTGAPTTGDSENDAVIAAIIAEDIQQMDTDRVPDAAPPATQEPSQAVPDEPEPQASTAADIPAPSIEPEVPQPVDHVYYFIQKFDVEAQALRTVGSFFSKKEENIKTAVRRHLKIPPMKDFQIWQRVDGTTVTTMASGETFEVYVPDGTCFIVGDKLNKDR